MKHDLEPIIEQIYDAVKQPEEWKDVVDRVVRTFASNSGILSIEKANQSAVLSSQHVGFDDDAIEQYASYYFAKDVWTRKLTELPSTQFYPTHIHTSQKQYLNSEWYTDWGSLCRMHYALGGHVASSGNLQVRLAIQRSEREGHYQPEENHHINRLFAHLRRAMDLSQHFADVQLHQQTAQQILDQLSVAAFAVEVDGLIQFQNSAAELLLQRNGVLVASNNRLKLKTREQGQLSWMLKANILSGQGKEQQYIPALQATAMNQRLELRISPLVVTEHQFGFQTRKVLALVLIKPLNDIPPNSAELGSFYGLTNRQTQIAARLCQGHSIDQAATEMQIKASTARSHLKSIFQKTQTNSQSQLVALLLGSATTLVLPK